MKQLTLEISERQEEEELQVKRASQIWAVGAMWHFHVSRHSHLHILVGSLLYSWLLSSFSPRKRSNSSNESVLEGSETNTGVQEASGHQRFATILFFIGSVPNMNAFQGAPDADLIFGSGKRAPPKWIHPEDCCGEKLVIVELYLPSPEGSDYYYICERPVIYRRLGYIDVAEMFTKATSRRWLKKANIKLEIYFR